MFLQFLRERAVQAETLYILGDLFEAWIGDDEDSQLSEQVCDGLRRLTERGTRSFVAHGNRDFLLGSGFEARTGTTLLDQATVLDLYGTRTLLLHGDELCTDDLSYQTMRQQLRNPQWQREFLDRPLSIRRQMAAQLRETSRDSTQEKSMEIMDVNQNTLEAFMRRYGATRLIHGHTHRPAVHSFLLDGQSAERIVLADWESQGHVLSFTPDGEPKAETLD
jgi:UDP-2,3-diacylglucosamine hydrolase